MSMFDKIRNAVRGGARGAVSIRRGSAAPTISSTSRTGRAATGLTSYFQQAYRTGNHARPPATLRRK